MLKRTTVAPLVCVLLLACSRSETGPSPVPSTQAPPTEPTSVGPPAVLVGAGDIAVCSLPGAEATARLLDVIQGTVFTTGDNAYPNGSAEDFARCYGPTWGRHRGRTRPSPGNHDYQVPNAAPYFDYFGVNAGPAGLGYYSYDLGAWHVISLNSETAMHAGSPQERWLRDDLAANPTRCTAAYWHRPLFSSGRHGPSEQIRPVWRALYEFDVDVVITGHDHLYERFAPQDPDGRADAARGIRQFVVGTGGAERREAQRAAVNSEVAGRDWGVLALTLERSGYRWEFVPVAGASFRDSGSAACH